MVKTCSKCKHLHKEYNEEPCMSCDFACDNFEAPDIVMDIPEEDSECQQ